MFHHHELLETRARHRFIVTKKGSPLCWHSSIKQAELCPFHFLFSPCFILPNMLFLLPFPESVRIHGLFFNSHVGICCPFSTHVQPGGAPSTLALDPLTCPQGFLSPSPPTLTPEWPPSSLMVMLIWLVTKHQVPSESQHLVSTLLDNEPKKVLDLQAAFLYSDLVPQGDHVQHYLDSIFSSDCCQFDIQMGNFSFLYSSLELSSSLLV